MLTKEQDAGRGVGGIHNRLLKYCGFVVEAWVRWQTLLPGKAAAYVPWSKMTKLYILFDSPEVSLPTELFHAIFLPWLEFSGSLVLGDLLSVMYSGNFFHRSFKMLCCGGQDIAHLLLITGSSRQDLLSVSIVLNTVKCGVWKERLQMTFELMNVLNVYWCYTPLKLPEMKVYGRESERRQKVASVLLGVCTFPLGDVR